MGQPGRLKACHPMHIGGERGELKHLVPAGRENKNDSPSSGERTGKSPNRCGSGRGGVVGLRYREEEVSGTYWKVRP